MLQLKQRLAARPTYYGWTLAWLLGPTQLITWGILYYTFAVMLAPMQRELGWSVTELTGAFSLALLAGGLSAIPVGRWLDRHGPHWMMTLGVAAAALLVFGWSRVQSLPTFYALWFGMGLLMAAVLYEPAMWIIARWFSGDWHHRRGRALTILTFFGGLASTVFIPLSNLLQQAYGWRAALAMLAVVLAAGTVVPYALLLRPSSPRIVDEQQDTGARQGWRSFARSRAFWQLAASFVLTAMAWSALSIHLFAFGLSQGLDASFVAAVAGMVGVMQVAGRLTLVPLSDRVSPQRIAAALCVVQAAAPAALLLLPPVPGLVVYVVAFGVGHGAMTPLRASIVADAFGVGAFGGVSGALSFVTTMLRAIAPVAAGVMIASLGGYSAVLIGATGASLVAALLLWRPRLQT